MCGAQCSRAAAGRNMRLTRNLEARTPGPETTLTRLCCLTFTPPRLCRLVTRQRVSESPPPFSGAACVGSLAGDADNSLQPRCLL